MPSFTLNLTLSPCIVFYTRALVLSVRQSNKLMKQLRVCFANSDSTIARHELVHRLTSGQPTPVRHFAIILTVQYCGVPVSSFDLDFVFYTIDDTRLQIFPEIRERFASIRESKIRSADRVIVMFNVTSMWSFNGAQHELAQLSAQGKRCLLIGDTIHLATNAREVSEAQARALAQVSTQTHMHQIR
jgi:hypothetical protein